MAKPRNGRRAKADRLTAALDRVNRPLSLVAQVEQALRQAIAEDRFPNGKLPTEVELAEQLSVSRETVRLAAETLQHEGLLVKIRSRGTFTRPPPLLGQIKGATTKLLGYLQTDFVAASGEEEVTNRAISGLMLQGALAEAGATGFTLEVHHTPHTQWREAVQKLCENARLAGVILASYNEEKLLRRLAARGLPVVLLDEDTKLPHVHSVRDDCFEGARQAVFYLAQLGHRRIAYAHWQRADMNRWRPMGYQRGLRDAGLPCRRNWEILTEMTETGSHRLIDQFLGLAPRPTALYCFNNTLALFAVEELQRRGVRVPEEVSVLGGGGEEISGLTCHQTDWYQMGRHAARILVRSLSALGQQPPEHYLAPHVLRLGRTTGSPPAKAK